LQRDFTVASIDDNEGLTWTNRRASGTDDLTATSFGAKVLTIRSAKGNFCRKRHRFTLPSGNGPWSIAQWRRRFPQGTPSIMTNNGAFGYREMFGE
jgi:hypothetical protein